MKKIKSVLMNDDEFNRTLKRLAHEIIENHSDLDNVVIIGIRTRGEFLARKINNFILEIAKKEIPMGILDVTFYRDDFRTNLGSPQVQSSDIMFPIENKKIILIDDVLYTGRTIRAAMEEIFSLGRPDKLELAVLIDRGHRQLPIKANYVGKNYPTSFNEHVHVYLSDVDDEESVKLLEYNEQA